MRTAKPSAPHKAVRSILTPVTRTTLTADICREMVSHLIRGDWAEGERLPPERELCRQLGVGRASLREAMKALEIMGMIETRLGDGTFVCHRSEFLSRPLLWAITSSRASDLRELVEARRLIEVELAGFATERASSDDLQKIGKHLEQMEAALDNASAFEEADVNFHLAIAGAAHNRVLNNALQLTRNMIQTWIGQNLLLPGVAPEALRHHRQIYSAILGKQPEQAKAAMGKHVDRMASHLLQSSGKQGSGDFVADLPTSHSRRRGSIDR
jgi:GntR family transcriptional repressor for pyruvate dehydrogenase complex